MLQKSSAESTALDKLSFVALTDQAISHSRDNSSYSTAADVVVSQISAVAKDQKAQKNAIDLGKQRDSIYSRFRDVCSSILMELEKADQFIFEGVMQDEGLEVTVEVDYLLEVLYEIAWGKNESLKKIVVLMQSQILNAIWTPAHLDFMKDAMSHIRRQYYIDDSVVGYCFELINTHALNAFRGTVLETANRKRFKIVEIDESNPDGNS